MEYEHELISAAARGDLVKLEEISDSGVSLRVKCSSGRTPICYAARKGHAEFLRRLIEKDQSYYASMQKKRGKLGIIFTKVETTSEYVSRVFAEIFDDGLITSATALGIALEYDHYDCVEILLDAGAKVCLCALYPTIRKGRIQFLNKLLTYKIAKKDLGEAFWISAFYRWTESADVLVSQGNVPLDMQFHNYASVLLKSCYDGRSEDVKKLIAAGAKVSQKIGGTTAMSHALDAAKKGRGDGRACMLLLLNAGYGNFNHDTYYNAVLYAAESEDAELLRAFLTVRGGMYRILQSIVKDTRYGGRSSSIFTMVSSSISAKFLLDIVLEEVERGPRYPILSSNDFGYSYYHTLGEATFCAIRYDCPDALKRLIAWLGVRKEKKYKEIFGYTEDPKSYALSNGSPKCFRVLLKECVPMLNFDSYDISSATYECLQVLLEECIASLPKESYFEGLKKVHTYAASIGATDIVERTISLGVPPNLINLIPYFNVSNIALVRKYGLDVFRYGEWDIRDEIPLSKINTILEYYKHIRGFFGEKRIKREIKEIQELTPQQIEECNEEVLENVLILLIGYLPSECYEIPKMMFTTEERLLSQMKARFKTMCLCFKTAAHTGILRLMMISYRIRHSEGAVGCNVPIETWLKVMGFVYSFPLCVDGTVHYSVNGVHYKEVLARHNDLSPIFGKLNGNRLSLTGYGRLPLSEI